MWAGGAISRRKTCTIITSTLISWIRPLALTHSLEQSSFGRICIIQEDFTNQTRAGWQKNNLFSISRN